MICPSEATTFASPAPACVLLHELVGESFSNTVIAEQQSKKQVQVSDEPEYSGNLQLFRGLTALNCCVDVRGMCLEVALGPNASLQSFGEERALKFTLNNPTWRFMGRYKWGYK